MRQLDHAHGFLHIDFAIVLQQAVLRVVVVFAGDAVLVLDVDELLMSSISAISAAFSAFRASMSLMVLSRVG